MPTVYSYTFTSEGDGPWWGLRCSNEFYQETVRGLDNISRCFVYITNIRGETMAVAIEGPHSERVDDDVVFVPAWVLERLNINEGDEIIMDAIIEPLPSCQTVTIRPLTGSSVEGPIFLEGLTEALNQLGVIQEGLLYAVVDPSTNEMHKFMIERLNPMSVCLADGELQVNLERAMDRPPTPIPVSDVEEEPENFNSVLPPSCIKPSSAKGFVPFSGVGHKLGDN
jgi:hypothetical protein